MKTSTHKELGLSGVFVRTREFQGLMGIRDKESMPGRPRGLASVLSKVSIQLTGYDIRPWSVIRLFDSRSVMFACSPSIVVLMSGLLNSKLVYLCWGTPVSTSRVIQSLKLMRLRWILRNASIVLANEFQTSDAIRALAQREAMIVPFLVDTNFFRYAPRNARDEYVMVPGDADRDEDLVIRLAERGTRIVRVSRDPLVRKFYGTTTRRNVSFRYRVDDATLVHLYQHARVVAIPITSSNHAAGQTAILEAISCGAPIVLSRGRTSDLFRTYETVRTCIKNHAEEWLHAIAKTTTASESIRKCSAERVRRLHGPETVTRLLKEILSQAQLSPDRERSSGGGMREGNSTR